MTLWKSNMISVWLSLIAQSSYFCERKKRNPHEVVCQFLMVYKKYVILMISMVTFFTTYLHIIYNPICDQHLDFYQTFVWTVAQIHWKCTCIHVESLVKVLDHNVVVVCSQMDFSSDTMWASIKDGQPDADPGIAPLTIQQLRQIYQQQLDHQRQETQAAQAQIKLLTQHLDSEAAARQLLQV